MRNLLLVPVVLAALVLGAHLLRGGEPLLAVGAAAVPLLLLFRRTATLRALQAFLVLGAGEWVRTLLSLVELRRAEGMPWHRLVAILGVVALVTLLAALAAGRWSSSRAGGVADMRGAVS